MGRTHISAGKIGLAGLILPITALSLSLGACTPTVKIEPPDKPITINLNVKIEHEVRIKVEKDVDELLSEDSDLF